MVIRELAISGGGVKGLAFAATVYALRDRLRLRAVAGASIGAFIATCLACGYDPGDLVTHLFETDFEATKDVDLETHRLSIMKGDALRAFFRTFLRRRNGDTTFKELFARTRIRLVIVATGLSSGTAEYFSYETHPDVHVLDALCASAAIPLVFPPVRIGGRYYIDGGVVDNLPLSALGPCAVGIVSPVTFCDNVSKVTLFEYIGIVLKIMTNRPLPSDRVIQVSLPKGVGVLSFDVTVDEKYALIRAGLEAGKRFKHRATPSKGRCDKRYVPNNSLSTAQRL